MNNKTINFGFILRIAFYVAVVVLTLIGWLTSNAGLTLGLGYGLLVLSLLMVIGFSIMGLIDNPKKSLMSLLGIAVLILLFIIAFSTASTESVTQIEVSDTFIKLAGASLTTLYVVGGLTVLSIIAGEIYSMIK